MTRTRWQGMLSILRFNLPLYLAAAFAGAIALTGLFLAASPWLRCGWAVVLAGAVWFLVGSLAVSHRIYDRSDLYRWGWLGRALGGLRPQRVILCHTGFDEVSAALQRRIASPEWIILDHFDPAVMTEPSIRRARRLFPPVPGTIRSPFFRWPPDDRSADLIFGLLAIHELRGEADRIRWFVEARRCLSPGGRVVLAEHARDRANFLAFGPGFLHFHSPASWRKCWTAAGLRAIDEFRVTSWVRIFVLAADD